MTATREPPASTREPPPHAGEHASPSGSERLETGHPAVGRIRYGPAARFADWYHGWRDGRAGIPPRPKPRADGTRRIITTPHRETIIRSAQGGFEQERQRWEGLQAGALERRAVAEARQEKAEAALTTAQEDLATATRPLTETEKHRRRHGEEHRPDSVVVQRRLREHWRRAAAVRARLGKAERELATAAQSLSAADQEIKHHLAMARARVLRIHKHAHKRMAAYRRTLIRWHKLGAWLSTAMAITEPELPTWAEFAPIEELVPPEPPEPVITDDLPPDTQVTGSVIRLPLYERTVFGSHIPEASYVALDGVPRHFALTRQDGTYRLEGFGHRQGPFVSGQPVKTAILPHGGYFDFRDARYRISEDGTALEIFPLSTTAAEYDFIVSNLGAKNRGKPRLVNMSFVQRRKELLAILGPSGAGKSSLFAALVGELKPESGDLYFMRFRLQTHRPQIRAMLGYVPQDENLFRTLTVRRLLRYAYQLRESGDHRKRDERIDQVCDQLQIKPQLDQLIGTLSGGQRKRVSIAMELLSKPALLLLDEPTSGLDAGMDREVLTILSKYAVGREEHPAGGRTVMVITHSTEHLGITQHVLVVAKGGAPVYFGPPGKQLLDHFAVTSYADLMRTLANDNAAIVARVKKEYEQGPETRLASAEATRVEDLEPDQPAELTPRGPVLIGIRQFWVLMQRQVALLATRGITKNRPERRRHHMVMGVVTPLMPLIIAAIGAVVAGVVGSSAGLGPSRDRPAAILIPTTLSLLVTLCMLSGQALTYGDVINDYPTLRREHRTGTLTVAAMLAKWVVFAAVATLQALVITLVYVRFWPGPAYSVLFSPAGELFLDLAAMTVAAMTLGLLISSVFKKLEQAVAAITGVSIAQIAFNGAFANLSGNPWLAGISVLLPSRWGVAAAASSIKLRGIAPGAYPDGLWQHSTGQWVFDMIMLTGLGAVFLFLAIFVLSRRLNSPD